MERHQAGDERGRGVVTLGSGVAAGFWVGARVGSGGVFAGDGVWELLGSWESGV